ncbi:uncharacterized mitochondrial protein-like protein, partial [Tanacetum coccineum]
DSLLELVAYTDSDYAGATQDRKSTTGGCQFLGNRLISWQCKKQTVVATSTTEAEYVAAASCYGQGRNVVCSSSVGFHTTQQMVISSPCLIDDKELTSPEQTAPALASLKQTAIGKDASNPFMAGSLPKTTLCVNFYALTKKPKIYISFIKQFWRTVKASTDTDEDVTIIAIIDGQSKTITEASLKRHLKLEYHDGITSIPNSEIFEQLALIGYQTDSDKRNSFKTRLSTYTCTLSNNKVFSNMRRLTKGYTGVEIGLFPTMLTSPTTFIFPIKDHIITFTIIWTSSTEPTFEPQHLPDVKYHVPSPNESPLHAVHLHGSDEGNLKLIELMNLVTKLSESIGVLEDDLKRTKQHFIVLHSPKLILRIKKLESKVKTGKARKRARVMLSEDEEDDSSKQGRIDEGPNTYFHQDDEVDDDVVHDAAEERQP